MKKTILMSIAVLCLSAGAASAQKKAVVNTNYRDFQDARVTIEEVLEQNGFQVDDSSRKKVTAVFSPGGMRPGMPGGQRPDGQGKDGGQRPQGGGRPGGMGGGQGRPGGMGPGSQGGPGGMGPGGQGGFQGRDFSNDDQPYVTVKLAKKGGYIRATFRAKKFNTKSKDNQEGPRGLDLRRIVERIPNSGIQYK